MYLYLFHIISVSHESHMLARQMFTVVAIPYLINAKPSTTPSHPPRTKKSIRKSHVQNCKKTIFDPFHHLLQFMAVYATRAKGY
jgi:hypothetical protein